MTSNNKFLPLLPPNPTMPTTPIILTTAPSALDSAKKWITGAAVLRKHPNQPTRLLILKRVPHETSYANLWEIPGGHIEATDPDIQHVLARELREETGLELSKVVKRLNDMTWTGRSGTTSVQLNFVVEMKCDEAVRLCEEEHCESTWVCAEEMGGMDMTAEMRVVVREALGA